MKHFCLFSLYLVSVTTAAFAGEANIIAVEVEKTGNQAYQFKVTVHHDDTGWDHYADRWEVLALDGTLLGTRVLAHPHVNEQPFTRSLSGIKIPKELNQVTIKAHDSVHAYGGETMRVNLH